MPATPVAPVWSVIRLLGLALALAACRGSSGPAPAPPATPVVSATPRLSADDFEVAKVNGRSVWSSCVVAQASVIAAGARTAGNPVASPRAPASPVAADARAAEPQRAASLRARALEQCVAFELLAQAAEARGAAAAREVSDAVRTAAVNRLVEVDFEQRYRTPADLGRAVDIVMKRNEWRMHILELRASTFARFLVPAGAPAELDARAHALADQLAAQLAGQTGLYGVHLTEAAKQVATGTGVEIDTSDVKPTHKDDLVEPYAKVLYAIAEVGRIGPVARTQWGWDVVMWTGGVAARERSRDEVVAELFPELRRRQFQLWVSQLGKQLGVHIEVDPATAAKLDTGEAP